MSLSQRKGAPITAGGPTIVRPVPQGQGHLPVLGVIPSQYGVPQKQVPDVNGKSGNLTRIKQTGQTGVSKQPGSRKKQVRDEAVDGMRRSMVIGEIGIA